MLNKLSEACSALLSINNEVIAMEKEFVNYSDLRRWGFGDNQARRIIRMAKKRLVEKGFVFYNGKRVGLVPAQAVAEVIGIPLTQEGDNK
ncbi:DUF3173 domain-containing protein [Lactobacillus acidophilus]|uniref:DUF3173 domain-containing protein n=1 Tax=Lactobacillus acidophilus TaxID=1579 RepID=UPI0021A7F829